MDSSKEEILVDESPTEEDSYFDHLLDQQSTENSSEETIIANIPADQYPDSGLKGSPDQTIVGDDDSIESDPYFDILVDQCKKENTGKYKYSSSNAF